MKTEKIIASIEAYRTSLDEVGENIFKHSEIFQTLEQLKKEYSEAERKKMRGTDFVKRSKLAAKLVESNERERFKKAWFDTVSGEKMQCIMYNGYFAFALREPLNIPTSEENGEKPITFSKFVPNGYEYFENFRLDMPALKIEHAKQKANREKHTPVQLGEKRYNADYLIKAMQILGGDVAMYQNAITCGSDVLQSDNGIAIICPLNPKAL